MQKLRNVVIGFLVLFFVAANVAISAINLPVWWASDPKMGALWTAGLLWLAGVTIRGIGQDLKGLDNP